MEKHHSLDIRRLALPERTFIWRRIREVRKWRRHRGWVLKGVGDGKKKKKKGVGDGMLGAGRGWAKKPR